MKNIGQVELPAIQPRKGLDDIPLRNSLRYPRLKTETELNDAISVTFGTIGGAIADSAVLVAAFASKQNVLGYLPLDTAADLSDLSDLNQAIANLGLDTGGNHNIWLESNGGSMFGTITLHTILPMIFTAGTLFGTLTPGAVEFDGKKVYQTLYENRYVYELAAGIIVASTTVANTVVETNIFSADLAADSFIEAQMLKFLLYGRYSTANGVDTVVIRFKIGSTTIHSFSSTAAAVANAPLFAECVATIRSLGAGGTLWGFIQAVMNQINKHAAATATTAIDTTADQTFSITAQWSNADPGNTLSVDQAMFKMC